MTEIRLPRPRHMFRLAVKEVFSLRTDKVLLILIVYAFTAAVVLVARGATTEVLNAAVAVVDEDHTMLSCRLTDAIGPPHFQPPDAIAASEVDRAMDQGRYTFVLDIPPDFERDVLRRRLPVLQLNVDATAMTYAGNGSSYLQAILGNELYDFIARQPQTANTAPLKLVVRAKFNPNLEPIWFMAVMQLINSITILAIMLTGAAIIREREHGTLEHLLVMPLTPLEIMLAKIGANGLVILVAVLISLVAVVNGVLGVPIHGSVPVFLLGAASYLFAISALGILLATFVGSMPQFSILIIPIFISMYMLSGSITPLESMPVWLQRIMLLSPSTHFVKFCQAVLFRGAGLDIVWPELSKVAAIGGLFFAVALARFRRMLQVSGG